MTRAWLAAAAIAEFFSVAAGAATAHVTAGDAHGGELLRTGAFYGMIHAVALVAVAAIAEHHDRPRPLLIMAAWSFVIGVFLFSFSLFALTLTRIPRLAQATPFGGVNLLLGWAALGGAVIRRR